MPSWWEFIIIILSVWRIVTFIQDESGPWDVMLKIRSKLGIVHDDDKCPTGWPDGLIGGLFKCFWCLSFWVGIIVLLIWLILPWFILIFAISTGAILINEIITRLKHG
jgi:hypothetical protein